MGTLVLAFPACTESDFQPDRPTGVEADQWYPISPKLGLVLTQIRKVPGLAKLTEEEKEKIKEIGFPIDSVVRTLVDGAPVADGVLMAKVDGYWAVVELPLPPWQAHLLGQ